MKLSLTLLTCLILFSPNVVLSETMSDLVRRDGLYYKKFSQVPFSGKTTGKSQGTIKNGIREGAWVDYNKAGTVNKKYTGTFKNGKKISNE